MRWTVIVCSTVLLAACSSGGDAQPLPTPTASAIALPSSTTEALSRQLTTTMARNDVPGAAVEVCIPGYEDWATAQGVSDVQSQTPLTTDAVWPIRSITKSVTVTLILQLVDERCV